VKQPSNNQLPIEYVQQLKEQIYIKVKLKQKMNPKEKKEGICGGHYQQLNPTTPVFFFKHFNPYYSSF